MLSTTEIYMIADEIMKRFERLDRFNQNGLKSSEIIELLTKERDSLRSERDELQKLIDDIANAVNDEGVYPPHHRKVMFRHRSEWPFLWRRIDKAIKKVNK